MKVRVTASFDERTGDVQAEIRVGDEFPMDLADVYHRPLLILYTAYRLWAEQSQPEAEFRLDKREYPDEDIVGRVNELRKNSTKNTGDPEEHYARRLFQVRDTDGNDLVFITTPKLVRVNPSLLSGRDITVMLGKHEVSGVESLGVFLELLKMNCNPAKRLLCRYRGIRENLVYQTWLSDVPFNAHFSEEFSKKDYLYFKATANFDRTPLYPRDRFSVGLVDTSTHLLRSIGDAFKEGTIFREVYSVTRDDRDKLKLIRDEIEQAEKGEKQACLDKLFHVRVTVDDQPAELENVEAVSGGKDFLLTYRLPDALVRKLRLHFKIEVLGFQRRSQNSFPMVISEPTRNVKQEFQYMDASVEHVDYFVGATVGPENTRVEPEHDTRNKYFRATSPADFFLSPGEGTVVHWTPMEKTEWISLVRLNQADHGIIDARYATTNNLFRERIYPCFELFLVADAAEKLRAAHLQLQREGFKLIVLDAYRPPDAHRRMLALRPDLKDHITSPDIGSVHSRGCAVDVTLADASGKELPMPTKYDEFYTAAADPETIARLPDGDEIKTRFDILRKCMTANGFQVRKNEWCHFELREWRRYPLLDIEPYRQASAPPPINS